MAAEHITPVDELTGIPLPIAPQIQANSHDASPESDWHHHFHPRRSPLLKESGGLAVRHVRLQLADWNSHHIDYHNYYTGPPLPETEQDQFNVVVFAAAGYIPEQAISFKRGKPRVINTSDEQRANWWQSGEIKTENYDVIKKFIGQFALQQSLAHIDERLIDEFLHTNVDERRRYLGHLLLAKKIEKATEPIESAYHEAWKNGLISPTLPTKPTSFIKTKLVPIERRKKLMKEMKAKLAA